VRRTALSAVLVVAVGAGIAPASAGARSSPKVRELVVYKSGRAKEGTVRAKGVKAKVGRHRCAVGTGTPLAALFRLKPGKVSLKDFGSCSRRASDAAGLFVRAIRHDRNKGQNGWIYKVGRKSASAGSADPSGPFGRGRLRSGSRVVWFYCFMKGTSCQRTLSVRPKVASGGTVSVKVTGYDDNGKGKPAAGAKVRLNGAAAVADAAGVAQFQAPTGRYRVYASKAGAVRSFGERVVVK
jgi:hypothetical protein